VWPLAAFCAVILVRSLVGRSGHWCRAGPGACSRMPPRRVRQFCTRSHKWGSFVIGRARRSGSACEPSSMRSRRSCANACATGEADGSGPRCFGDAARRPTSPGSASSASSIRSFRQSRHSIRCPAAASTLKPEGGARRVAFWPGPVRGGGRRAILVPTATIAETGHHSGEFAPRRVF
jgi:hypothetical protein